MNLNNVNFADATMTNVDLTGAVIAGARFGSTTSNGFTAAQFYSTASYASGDLTGVLMAHNDLSGWNFAGKNFTDGWFYDSKLTNADLTNCNLTGVWMDTADFSFADVRGAVGLTSQQWLATSSRRNAIYTNGTIDGLSLQSGERLVVRNHPIAIVVGELASLVEGSKLEMQFDESDWDSTISFQDGISVTLGGTLLLKPRDGVDGESLLGRTFDLFDWNGPLSQDNRFDTVESLPGYVWDISNLYTTGEITLIAVPEPATMFLLSLGGLAVLRRWS